MICRSTCVNVHRVSSNLHGRGQLVEHFLSRPKDRPVISTNKVATFAAAEHSKIKSTVNVSVQMREVDVLTKWKKMVLRGVSFGSVGRPDKVSVTPKWRHCPSRKG